MNFTEDDIPMHVDRGSLKVDKHQFDSLVSLLMKSRDKFREEDADGNSWKICDEVLFQLEKMILG